MYSIFVFETKVFVENTRYLFSDPHGRPESFIPSQDLFPWYDWMFGFILSNELQLPMEQGFHTRNATMETVYRSQEHAIRQAFQSVISMEEFRTIPMYGKLKYLFNGNQLFIFTCSQV